MVSRTAVCLSGVLGGACWILRSLLGLTDLTSSGDTLDEVLRWAGATWLLIALAGAGAALVRRSEMWLRVVVGVAVPLLALVFLSLAYDVLDRLLVDALVGLVVLVVSVLVWRRGRPATGAPADAPRVTPAG